MGRQSLCVQNAALLRSDQRYLGARLCAASHSDERTPPAKKELPLAQFYCGESANRNRAYRNLRSQRDLVVSGDIAEAPLDASAAQDREDMIPNLGVSQSEAVGWRDEKVVVPRYLGRGWNKARQQRFVVMRTKRHTCIAHETVAIECTDANRARGCPLRSQSGREEQLWRQVVAAVQGPLQDVLTACCWFGGRPVSAIAAAQCRSLPRRYLFFFVWLVPRIEPPEAWPEVCALALRIPSLSTTGVAMLAITRRRRSSRRAGLAAGRGCLVSRSPFLPWLLTNPLHAANQRGNPASFSQAIAMPGLFFNVIKPRALARHRSIVNITDRLLAFRFSLLLMVG